MTDVNEDGLNPKMFGTLKEVGVYKALKSKIEFDNA